MQNVGNSFSLPFRTPGWFGTFALMGLIGLIPIVGSINLYGWALTLLDNYRQGRAELPPAGFQYIGRGANVFVVFLVYGLVFAVILIGPFLLLFGAALGGAAINRGDSGAASLAAMGGLQLWGLGAQLVQFLLYLFMPAAIVATERGGIGAGLNPARVLEVASRNWGNTIIAALLVFAGFFLGGLGIILCCIGVIFTMPYGYAVLAGVVRFYEATFEPAPTLPPESPAPPQAFA